MPFPVADRVIYEHNPLSEVICQVRFPPVLRIDAESPAKFQESIRAEYPNYEAKSPVKLPTNVPPQLAEIFASELPAGGQRTHEFGSRDGVWKLSLTRSFLAMRCSDYRRWEQFRHRFSVSLDALQREYGPAYFTRIGLRYQDVLHRSKLGLAGEPWSSLLKPAVAGFLGASEVVSDVRGMQTATLVHLPGDVGTAQMQFALAEDNATSEEVFLIDSDYFTDQQVETADALARLDAFNREARRFFRWCITDQLHNAMRPGPVPPP